MKNKITFILTIVFMTLSFLSCTKTVQLDASATDPKLVVNCLCEPEKPVKVRLSKSYFVFNSNGYGHTELTGDAAAKLYVNGNYKENLSMSIDSVATSQDIYPIYISQYLPKVGDVIEIQASSKGFDDVTGVSDPIPDEANFEPILDNAQVEWQYDYEHNDWETDSTLLYSSYSTNTNLNLTITDDNPNSIDYYYIHFSLTNSMEDPSLFSTYMYVTYDDPVFEPVGINSSIFDYEIYNNKGFFSDKLFDGKSYTIKLPLEIDLQLLQDIQYNIRLNVYVQHISKAYYNYLNTYDGEDQYSIVSLFTEPVQIYSNVEGGFGIVAASNEKARSVDLQTRKK